MTPLAYQSIWTSSGDELAPINLQKISKFNLQAHTTAYMETGLPTEAAPYLSFVTDTDDKYTGLATLDDIYNIEAEYHKYVVIGSDGSGNPIAINTAEGDRIEWLDHENYFTASYFNSSIKTMLGFLIIYRDFVETLITQKGEEALLNANFTDEQFEHMRLRMLELDAQALVQTGFWKEELNRLLGDRDYYRLNP